MSESMPVEIRFLAQNEWDEAMELAFRTFLQFEGDVYPPEGIRSFEDFITDSSLKRMFVNGIYQMMGAYVKGKLVGMISLRNQTHISLLFVDGRFHKRGIGRALISRLSDYVREEEGLSRMTVFSSPYGVDFYHRLGFRDLGPQKQQDGIIYTPMVLQLAENS